MKEAEGHQGRGDDDLDELQRAFHELQVRQAELEAEHERLRSSLAHLDEAHGRLSDLYDFAPVVYLRLDARGRIVDVNLTAASFFGRERGRLIGGFLSSLVSSSERRALRVHLDACLNGRMRVDSELTFSVRGRSEMTAQVSSVPILNDDSAPIGCKTILVDISALKWSRDKLTFLNQASGLLGSSFDVTRSLGQIAHLAVTTVAEICILDIVDAAGGLCRLETAFADDLKAQKVALLRSASPRAPDGSALARVVRSREPLLFETVTDASVRAEGCHDPLVVGAAPRSIMYVPIVSRSIVGRADVLGVLTFILSASGRRYSNADVLTMRDLATHAAMAMENARLYREAQRAIAARQDVLSFVSHDLKSPLMGIMLTTETILRGAPSGDDRRRSAAQLRRIQHAAQQMRRMIDDLLDMTALETGRLAVDIGLHDAAQLLQLAGEQFTPLAAERELQLFVVPPPWPFSVACDRQRFAQVLSHLVDNALKFTPAGGRIAISVTTSGDSAVFTVADTGPGISPHMRPLIFERFSQLSPANRANGRGLGLYIAKGLVTAQRGSIWVDGEEGMGARFSFALPLALPAPLDTLASTMHAGASVRHDSAGGRGRGRGRARR